MAKDRHQQYPWDGSPREFESWNRDHSLASAFQYSVVPVYQEIARSIGQEQMKKLLVKFNYGNQEIGGNIDSFWLDGGLRISALEQIGFLQRLYFRELPVSVNVQEELIAIMKNEFDHGTLRAKTGWARAGQPHIGWWVGWIERGENAHFFALNMNISSQNDLALRQKISLNILQFEGVIPKSQDQTSKCFSF